MRNRRTFPALVVGGLLLVLFWPTTSTAPAPPADQPPAPGLERLAMLEELAFWRRGGENDFTLFGERPVSAAVQGRARDFALFGTSQGRGRQVLLSSLPYGALIEEAAASYRLDSLLVAAVVQAESGFDAGAISPAGAQGLMQLMPVTAQSYGASRPADPRANVRAGARYLRELLFRFDDDLELALAAYNAGPAAVRRFRGVPPYRETRQYVERVLTLYLGYHRTLWQEAQLDQLMGDLPTTMASNGPLPSLALFAPRLRAAVRRSGGGGRAVAVAAVAIVPAAQPLAEIANAFAEPLAERGESRVAEDQQHDGQDDQQLGDAKASEHGNLRGFGLWGGTAASQSNGFSLADRPAPPPTPEPAPIAPLAAPERRQKIATPAPASVPPA